MELTQNPSVLELVRKTAELTTPKEIVWIDGSEAQLDSLRKIAVETGELIKLMKKSCPAAISTAATLTTWRVSRAGHLSAPGPAKRPAPRTTGWIRTR